MLTYGVHANDMDAGPLPVALARQQRLSTATQPVLAPLNRLGAVCSYSERWLYRVYQWTTARNMTTPVARQGCLKQGRAYSCPQERGKVPAHPEILAL